MSAASLDVAQLGAALIAGNRRALAKAITLIESTRAEHREQAAELLDVLLPHTGKSLRLGISGVPGVGKSTFIEAFGMALIGQSLRVAVLAIDPSSTRSGGAILGDKTRMETLSQQANAFIRPSPSSGALGGVAARTREALLLCEAAGFDVVIIETVGVGQSETAVADMTDCFLLLLLPNAGDDLQAIKKGIMELADIIVFNKADLDQRAALAACGQMKSALRMLHPASSAWQPPVLLTSAANKEGIDTVWQTLQNYRVVMTASGELTARRQRQQEAWLWQLIDTGLRSRFRAHPAIASALPELTCAVREGGTSPSAAAQRLLNMLNRFF